MIERVAVIGDPHGCWEEFIELYERLCWISLDEIWVAGDYVDRGPHSGKVVEFCRKNNIKGILGNHCDSIINHYDRYIRTGALPKSKEKQRTISELSSADVDYLKQLPYLHIIDDLNLVIVHGGLYPKLPLYAQPKSVCRLQMIHPYKPGGSRWWGDDAKELFGEDGFTEAENLKQGWERWYKVYDHEQNVIFGHSTWAQPMIWQNPGSGKCIGVDTGSCFGGSVTACIMDRTETPFFVSVKAKALYYPDARRSFWEAE